jgi:hypothetical protein
MRRCHSSLLVQHKAPLSSVIDVGSCIGGIGGYISAAAYLNLHFCSTRIKLFYISKL